MKLWEKLKISDRFLFGGFTSVDLMKCKNRLILGSEENTKTSNGDDIIYSLNKKAIFSRGQLSSNFLKHLCRFSFPNIVSGITVASPLWGWRRW